MTAWRSKCTQSLKHSFKKVFVSHAQLAHFSTLAKEKHMLLILNFSTLTFITNARLHSQMVRTQSEPAEIPQHMFVQILVQVGGDRKWRTSRTTLRTPKPFVIRHCFLIMGWNGIVLGGWKLFRQVGTSVGAAWLPLILVLYPKPSTTFLPRKITKRHWPAAILSRLP